MSEPGAVDFSLYLISDRHLLADGRDLVEAVRLALIGGVGAVQLREKDLPAAALYTLARKLRGITREAGARLLINDRIDVALAVDADGVHLGGASLPVAVARQQLGPHRLIGVSTHRAGEIFTAAAQGADFVTFGPVYATPSKLPYGDPVGLDALRQACSTAPIPVFGLGGVTSSRVPELQEAGCTRAACIGAILTAADPANAARAFLTALAPQSAKRS
ncbi:thiamine phosphate synthase [Desulfuromonas sp. AOP6]|uniref:thiamine phosphate synthase n=1 Tax=Desulfuromonas sp. AOP6 TaxID=1566351 RepID=UPI00127070D7|nr:thiamine phosphate synthase [Desulfuromonas sp. AOP6]BCA78945.1 putative thiamine-phosphate synthase [Desulfuromonas sp. AOP6]